MVTPIRPPRAPVEGWWVSLRGSGEEVSRPIGWLSQFRGLRHYLHSGLDILDRPVSFYWHAHGSRSSSWLYRVDILVEEACTRSTRTLEASLDTVAPPRGLTIRELEVLTLVSGGLTNPEIASRIGTTRRTVATHLERLLEKLDVATRTAAAALALHEHLLLLPIPGGHTGLVSTTIQQLEATATSYAQGKRAGTAPNSAIRKRPMIIGGMYPLHGPAAADGAARRRATDIAINEINARGGVNGRALTHVPVEYEIDNLESLAHGIDTLVAREVDTVTFGYTLARDDFATLFTKTADYGCPLLHSATSSSAHEIVREQPDRFGNVFQVCAPESRYGTGFIRTVNELASSNMWQPHNRNILVIDSADPNLTTFTTEAAHIAERAGWNVTIEHVHFMNPDWRTVVNHCAHLEPAAVMVATWLEQSLLAFLRQLQEVTPKPLIYSLYAPSAPGFIQRAGALAEGLLWATVIGLYDDPRAREFALEFEHNYQEGPGNSGASIHYDLIHLLAETWQQAPNPHDYTRVNQNLRRIVYRGANGSYYFGTKGQSALAYPDDTLDSSIAQAHLVHQIQSGQHVIVMPAAYATGSCQPPNPTRAGLSS